MAVHFLLLLRLLLLFWTLKTPLGLSSCLKNCGNVSLWYPFGVGEDCYLDKQFEVTCSISSGSSTATLASLRLEIEDIDYSINSVAVKMNASFYNLSSSPFSFSKTYNRFVAKCCDNYAMRNSTTGHCLSICNCDPTKNRACCDFRCTLPPHLKIYSLSNIPKECNYSFMIDHEWLESYGQQGLHYLEDMKVAAKLEWDKRIGRCKELMNQQTNCNKDGYCSIPLSSSSSYYCLCDSPIPDSGLGCKGDLMCNTSSSSTCSKCPDGYSSEPNYKEVWCTPIKNINIHKKRSQAKLIIIIACCAGFGMLLLVIGGWRLNKLLKRRKAIKLRQNLFKKNGGLLLNQHLSFNEGNIEKTKLFTSKQLEKATDKYNANRIIGQGGQGMVYKGMLAEGRIVAVKKSKVVDESKLKEFINEVVILSHINHRNVVQLLGCCLEMEVPVLVYEFIPNGNLFQHLHDQNEDFPITWELRLRIAIEVSGALLYLHSYGSLRIYHRDIKSTNILLDEKYRAKVSDFGSSRSVSFDQTHLTTQVQGTFGYLDPEYFRLSQFTEKSDVYSFGVVLAELLTGQKPIRSAKSEEDKSLVAYFLRAMKENRLFKILDARVLKEGGEEEIMTVADLTRRCLNSNGRKRPTMRQVAIELAGIRVSNGATTMQQSYGDSNYVDPDDMTSSDFEIESSLAGSFSESIYYSVNIDP